MNRISYLLVGAVMVAAPARADVRITRETDMVMNIMGEMKMRSTGMETHASGKSRIEADMAMEGGWTAAQGGATKRHTVMISRYDKGVLWNLDPEAKSYRETSFSEAGMWTGRMGAARPKKKIVSVNVTVTGPDGGKTISGYSCVHYLTTIRVETEDAETHAKITYTLKNNSWNAPAEGDLAKARAEVVATGKAAAKALGWDEETGEWTRGMERAFGMLGVDGKEFSTALKASRPELEKVKGFPIQSDVEWMRQGDAAAKTGTPSADEAAADAAAAFLNGEAGRSDSVLLKVHTVITKVEVAPAPADAFEIPAGYSKNERPARRGGGD